MLYKLYAGSGIGRDLAKKLVESGAETFALSRTLSDLKSLKEEVDHYFIFLCSISMGSFYVKGIARRHAPSPPPN